MTPPIATGSGRIFISYRREETAYPAGWLYDRLVDHFGGGQVFKDIDSIVLGDDFVDVITEAVESCDVLLALIGDQWLTVTDADGRRRIDDPDDFVRLEIEAALSRDVRVIPILVDGATMPKTEDLPESLAKLVRRQALELSPSRFESDTDRLVRVLDNTLTRAAPAGRSGASAPAAPAPAQVAEPATGVGGRPGRRNLPLIVGLVAVAAVAVLVIALVASRGGHDSGGAAGSAVATSDDDLQLSDLQRSVGHRPAHVGDTVSVGFVLTNVGDEDIRLEGTFVAARDGDDDNRDTDYGNTGTTLAPGESTEAGAQIALDDAGTWRFWPCYELTTGSTCPDEWEAFSITVEG